MGKLKRSKSKAKFKIGDLVIFIKPWPENSPDPTAPGEIHVVEAVNKTEYGDGTYGFEYATNNCAWVEEEVLILGIDCTDDEDEDEEDGEDENFCYDPVAKASSQ